MKKIYISFILFVCTLSLAKSQGKLVFNYDDAGNQTKRTYSTSKTKVASLASEENLTTQESNTPEEVNKEDLFRVYPNPTNGLLFADWLVPFTGKVTAVRVQGISNSYNQTFLVQSKNQNKVNIDLSSQPSGIYVVVFYLNNGNVISKKIIKN